MSPAAQVLAFTKIFSLGGVVGNFISVPNSLGPGELLVKYGTAEQKQYYLPRLANGEEIPCFALTAPLAGSDATSIPDTGIVSKGQWQDKEIIGMRLNINKRYITLAPIATLIGLAFKLKDPDHLIGDKEDYGITCALVPRDTAGLEIGRRHYPIGDPFSNGPIRGQDIFVPLDFIIGGRDMDQTEWTVGAPGANTWYLDFTFRDIVVTDPNTGFWTASGNTGGIDADSSGFLVFKDDADIDGDGNSDLLRGIGLADYRDGTPGWFNIGGPAPQGPYVSSWLADTTGFVDMQTFVPNDPNSYNRSGACCKDFGYRAERVPEPAGVMLMGLGLLGLLRTRRRT